MKKFYPILIVLFLLILIASAYYLQKGGFPQLPKQKAEEIKTIEKYPNLKALVASEMVKVPDAPWVSIVYNQDMSIVYAPKDDAYFVTIFNREKETSVKEGVKKYFEALGVKDFGNLKIEFRVKPEVQITEPI